MTMADDTISLPGGTLDNVFDLTRTQALQLVIQFGRLPNHHLLPDRIEALQDICGSHPDAELAGVAAPVFGALAKEALDLGRTDQAADLACRAVHAALKGGAENAEPTITAAHKLLTEMGRTQDLLAHSEDLRDLHKVNEHDLLPSLPDRRAAAAPLAAAPY